jgi:hypothetical protein
MLALPVFAIYPALVVKALPSAGCRERNYDSSINWPGFFLCFGLRSSRSRLSTNFFEGRMGARSRGRSSSFLMVSFRGFFGTRKL